MRMISPLLSSSEKLLGPRGISVTILPLKGPRLDLATADVFRMQ
jgi:hypothetical protein